MLAIGDKIEFSDADAILNYLMRVGKINKRDLNIIRSAISEKSLSLAGDNKSALRAAMLKNMILSIM